MIETPITDDEILFRRILANKGLYETLPDGRVLFSSQAFADRTFRPSVDRASLCDNSPKHSLGPYSDKEAGVTSLITGDVRGIIEHEREGLIQTFFVDVEHKPIEKDPDQPDSSENFAHAEIYTTPPCTKGVFKKLRERLALLANASQWALKPSE
ncbi:MAG TPA: hypothetical protein VJ761_08235 [Ktedonobacteraceae bacterium]|nr:hypothetical protein [Ktedonobacteraceae bacterium]